MSAAELFRLSWRSHVVVFVCPFSRETLRAVLTILIMSWNFPLKPFAHFYAIAKY